MNEKSVYLVGSSYIRTRISQCTVQKRKVCISTKGKEKAHCEPTILLTVEVSGTARFQFFMAVFMKDGVLTNVTPFTLITFD